MVSAPLGVGILGAGPVAQAIHLPTLARLADQFRVAAVMDIDESLARVVAARCGGRPSTSLDDVLADPAVDVVMVGSPHHVHAEQLIAACEAAKRAVLVEKPLATGRADVAAIGSVAAETKVPVVVGAMHTFDPAWRALLANAGDLVQNAHTVRSSIVLPPNPRFEDFSAQIWRRPTESALPPQDLDASAASLRGGVLGLAIHDLPLIREFLDGSASVEVLSAHVRRPGGYLINLRVGSTYVQVNAVTTRHTWQPSWIVEAVGEDATLTIDFGPSYVHAGSGVGRLTRDGRTTEYGPYPENGYEREWRYVGALARGEAPRPDIRRVLDDLVFALDIADGAIDRLRADSYSDAEDVA